MGVGGEKALTKPDPGPKIPPLGMKRHQVTPSSDAAATHTGFRSHKHS